MNSVSVFFSVCNFDNDISTAVFSPGRKCLYLLFINNAVSISDCVASNERTINE
jgi:hypothetical protein